MSRSRLSGGFGRPPKPLTPDAEALFNLVKQAGADLGQAIGWQPSGGVCDGNNIAACGVPVVDTMGVRGGKIHSMEEYLIADSLGERAGLSALTILRLAGRRRMSFRVRPAHGDDFRAIYQMAKLTGGGFTNLPADRGRRWSPSSRVPTRASRAKTTARRPTCTCSCSRIPRPARSAAPARCSARSGSCSPSTPTI